VRYTVQCRTKVQGGALESLQESIVDFLGYSGTFFETDVFCILLGSGITYEAKREEMWRY
jgi:hypothetical protein